MNHTCNPWCSAGFHAVLFESEQSEVPILAGVAANMARNAGLEYVGFEVVAAASLPPAGSPTKFGLVRAKVVAWARGK
jgi:hypothetical protein